METVELLVILKLSGEYVKNSLNKYVDSISETHNAFAVLWKKSILMNALQTCLNQSIL